MFQYKLLYHQEQIFKDFNIPHIIIMVFSQ